MFSRLIAVVVTSLFMACALMPAGVAAKGASSSHSSSHSGTHSSESYASRGPSHSVSRSGGHSSSSHSQGYRSGNRAAGVARDAHGRIARSQQAKNEFKKSHPCPTTGKSSGACRGYVIDHLTPIKRGGAADTLDASSPEHAERR